MNIEVNYLAVFLAGVASFVVGYLWYSPLLLGKPWLKEKGMSMETMKKSQKDMAPYMGLSFIASLVTAYVLFHVMALSMNYFQQSALSTGLTSAFWTWFGFILPTQLTASVFGNKNWKLLSIETGYQLASVLAMAVVLASL